MFPPQVATISGLYPFVFSIWRVYKPIIVAYTAWAPAWSYDPHSVSQVWVGDGVAAQILARSFNWL